MISINEINKLKAENEAYKQSEQEAKEIIAELKAENERLKEDIKFYNSQLSARVVMLQKANTYLQEIKEIAKVIDTSECRERRKKARIIIQKISEVME